MTGHEFQRLIVTKWGKSYDIQLRRLGERMLLMVMWRYQEQQSFPLSQEEYIAHLEGILALLREWGMLEAVVEEIQSTTKRPRMGKAVTIPLELSHLGARASEWLL